VHCEVVTLLLDADDDCREEAMDDDDDDDDLSEESAGTDEADTDASGASGWAWSAVAACICSPRSMLPAAASASLRLRSCCALFFSAFLASFSACCRWNSTGMKLISRMP